MPRARLSAAEARRIALAAQGFAEPRRADGRAIRRLFDRVALVQIDSVNVLQRAHYMPLFSRMGPYDTRLLRRASERSPRRMVEYWAHVAAYMPVDLWPFMQHRMAGYRERGHAWTHEKASARLIDSLVAEIREDGAKTSRDLDDGLPRQKVDWGWNWSETKRALEYLFISGQLAVARRNSQFERVYDLPERVLPPAVLAVPTPTPEESVVGLVRRAAQALGVASESCLRDYFRTRPGMTREAIATLVDTGELIPVTVPAWGARPCYLWHQARLPRRIAARALLSPFDSMIFERNRLERLFDFVYRIEIYVPEPKRIHGYYVYPFLLDEAFVARVDLKADRARGVLRVNSAWLEPGQDPRYVAGELATELKLMAGWLGLSDVQVMPRGDLAPTLALA